MGQIKVKRPTLELGIRYAERKDSPPPGMVWIQTKAGDTLYKLAVGLGVRPIDLALMNWHTDVTEEINWYLLNYLGWSKPDGKLYAFSAPPKDQNKGWILVPNIPEYMKSGPPKVVAVSRDGKATLDSQLQVYVVEWLPTGGWTEVSGKWLYVFSGEKSSTGVVKDFGWAPPMIPPRIDAPPEFQPGSGIRLRHPGEYHLKEAPDKLEYEVMITAGAAPGKDLIQATTGAADLGKSDYLPGKKWYLCNDQALLKNATKQSRTSRTSYFLHEAKTLIIDLAPGGRQKRWYFLLSPVKLGPKALDYAMKNPNGLTPLLRKNALGLESPDDTFDPDKPDDNVGPTPEDVKNNPLVLPVIDPFSFSESIAELVYEDSLNTYIEWMKSKKNATVKRLHEDTGWPTLDHLFVARMLKAVRDAHPKPGKIDAELEDADKWKKNLKLWETELNQRHNEINANAHRSLLWLIRSLESPGHKIIETAILEDTKGDPPQDAPDLAHGIMHWAACTEHMFALEPGVVFLRDALVKDGSIPKELVTKHFKGLDTDNFKPALETTLLAGWKYGYMGLLRLQALNDFLSPPPVIKANMTIKERREVIADYNGRKRDNLIKLFNDFNVLPFKVQPLPLKSLIDSAWTWSTGSAAANAMLDFSDKWTTWIITPEIQIPRGPDRHWFLNRMGNIEEWFKKRPKWFSGMVNMGTSYALKGFAAYAGYRNFMAAIVTARYDYQTGQSTTSALDKVGAVAGATLAIQDILAEIGALGGNEFLKSKFPRMTYQMRRLQPIFPSLMTTGGPSWGVGAARVVGFMGAAFAGINVIAMVTSGVVTVISSYRSQTLSLSRGDYTAAAFYSVGIIGGAVAAIGGIVFGIALMEAGAGVSATGVGATVGVVLFLVGGIIAAIATVFGAVTTSDDYVVFARKCFLGVEGKKEPRFSVKTPHGNKEVDPPDWSMASKSGNKSWEIAMQKRGILNLLSKFKLETQYFKADPKSWASKPYIRMIIKPGLFMDENFIEIALYYKNESENTLLHIEFEDPKMTIGYVPRIIKGHLFSANDVIAPRTMFKGNTEEITVRIMDVNHNLNLGSLLTTVSMRNPHHDFVVRAKKLVDNSEIESGLFK